MPKLSVQQRIAPRHLADIRGQALAIPANDGRLTHLQFRRFAGCPICHLHLQSFVRRAAELQAAGIQEVVVFHSPAEDLRAHHAEAPFALIADPQRDLYREFGVETALSAVLSPQVWWAGLRGVARFGVGVPGKNESPLGLPGDFLIDGDGTVLDLYYGRHADDQWSFDEVVDKARALRTLAA